MESLEKQQHAVNALEERINWLIGEYDLTIGDIVAALELVKFNRLLQSYAPIDEDDDEEGEEWKGETHGG